MAGTTDNSKSFGEELITNTYANYEELGFSSPMEVSDIFGTVAYGAMQQANADSDTDTANFYQGILKHCD